MQAMKGATMALGSMNKSMNLPQLQKIAMEFERENDIMEQRSEMMDDAVDDAMDVGVEEEGDEVVEQVLEEIGVDFNQAVSYRPEFRFDKQLTRTFSLGRPRQPLAPPLLRKEELLKQSAVEMEEIRLTMTYRPVLIACESNMGVQGIYSKAGFDSNT